VAGITAAALSLLQTPLLFPLARQVEQRNLGLLSRMPLTTLARRIAGVLLLDYTLWWWHWINHQVPFFWRFHKVHHLDRDLDASTALRFHFGEMSLSVLFRMAQVRLLGVDRLTMSLWQLLLMLSILFHHSNLRLPWSVERRLVLVLVTPRMHGIHHSDYREETGSNWSSLLSFWDVFHGTFRLDVPQEQIRIGVPAFQRPGDVTLPRILALPFQPQPDDWHDPEGQPRIHRPAAWLGD
jgi:sterol desaturase/sphingolipid hydroxylase (fatty acid hydroxylase superfamily)